MNRSTIDFGFDIKKLEIEETDKKTLETQLADLQHYNYICCAYYRLKWVEKLHFLESLVKNLQNICSLSLLLNTIHASLRRMGRYMYTSIGNIFEFDKPLIDHNRMFQDDLVPILQNKNLEWYKTIKNELQESLIISLLRRAGGRITFHIYKVLEKEYESRLSKLKNEDLNPKPADDQRRPSIVFAHDEGDPLHKKCEQLNKEYTEMILAYKREIFGKGAKNEKNSAKKEKKNKKKKTKSKQKTKKTKKNKSDTNDSDPIITTMELLPMWTVKKIFSYLDAKSLTIAKKVNSYWKYAIDELIKEQKAIQFINQTIAKMSLEIDYSYVNDETQIKPPKFLKKSFHEEKMAQLKQRGAILEELRCDKSVPMEQFSVFIDVLKEINIHAMCPYKFSTIHPRVTKTNEKCYNEPNVFYKDVNLIVSNKDDAVVKKRISSFIFPTNSQMSLQLETGSIASGSTKKSSPSLESL